MSLLHQVALTYITNIGSTLATALVNHFGDAEGIFNAPKHRLLEVSGIGEKTIATLNFDEALKKAADELKFIEKNNIGVIFYTDSRYPKRFQCRSQPRRG